MRSIPFYVFHVVDTSQDNASPMKAMVKATSIDPTRISVRRKWSSLYDSFSILSFHVRWSTKRLSDIWQSNSCESVSLTRSTKSRPPCSIQCLYTLSCHIASTSADKRLDEIRAKLFVSTSFVVIVCLFRTEKASKKCFHERRQWRRWLSFSTRLGSFGRGWFMLFVAFQNQNRRIVQARIRRPTARVTVRRLCAAVPSNGESKSIVANMIRDHMDTLFSSMMEKTDRQLHRLRKKIDRLAGSVTTNGVAFVCAIRHDVYSTTHFSKCVSLSR
jgi:hypothetical protein